MRRLDSDLFLSIFLVFSCINWQEVILDTPTYINGCLPGKKDF